MGAVTEFSGGSEPGRAAAPAASSLGQAGFLRRTVAGWDVAFWLMLAIGFVIMVTAGLSGAELVIALGLLGILGAAYAVVGQRAVRTRALVARHVYRAVLVVVIAGLVYLQPEASFLLFIAFPQAWLFSDRTREGVGYTVLLVIGVATAESVRSGWAGGVFLDNLPWWSVSVLVSLVFGMWVSKIIDESGQRAELIDTLERTRNELAEANHAAGVVAERERLAREIHDTLAQGFTGIITLAESAQAQVTRGDLDRAVARVASIEAIARDNLAEARALVAAFSPLGLDDSTLIDALRRLAARFEAETGVEVSVTTRADTDEVALPAAHQVVLLRTAQEALANVRKHAAATRVEITLSTGVDGRSWIEVTDDGMGFEVGSGRSGGFGLAGMRGRVEEAGGELQVDSAPGAGTLIRVLLPPVSA